jgi:hypothetical protein
MEIEMEPRMQAGKLSVDALSPMAMRRLAGLDDQIRSLAAQRSMRYRREAVRDNGGESQTRVTARPQNNRARIERPKT